MHGLGNQLFQYAVGRNLSLKLNCPLKFDISHFDEKDSCRKYEMAYFCQPSLVETNLEAHINDEFHFHNQPHFRFDEKLQNITCNTFLIGFWQSEKYFWEHREILFDDLKIKKEFIKNVAGKATEIQKENSVCVHVRRGDYLQKANYFGVLSVGYYAKALDYLRRNTGKFKVYFFSDDMDWVKENIRIKEDHEFVSGIISKNNVEDFYLMTNCRHHIIANSSFSWWAAWLNPNKEKTIIAPEKWFNSNQYHPDDVVPDNWIKI